MSEHPAVLEALVRPEFEAEKVASTPAVLRSLVRGSHEFENLRIAHRLNAVTDFEIRRFVEDLLAAGRNEARFPHEHALAALAVLFEAHFTPLGQEFLSDLSRLNNPRFPLSTRVASISLAERSNAPSSQRKHFAAPMDPSAEASELRASWSPLVA